MATELLLASKSPRRRQLLEALGFPLRVVSIDVDEQVEATVEACEVAESLAKRKSEAYDVGLLRSGQILITADTIVVLDNRVLGKPHDFQEAVAMLKSLSGKKHRVYTGVCLKSISHQESFTECTEVHFKDLSEAEIDHYIRTYQPFDKAGSYGIQEWIGMVGIDSIEGCYYNVMGLPLSHLYDVLTSGRF